MDERVLILAPAGRDAALTAAQLHRAGLRSLVCADSAVLAAAIEAGAGVALVTDEALTDPALARLSETVARQPAWSDFAFLVFTSAAAGPDAEARVLSRLAPLGNVSLVERPVRIATLLSTVESALRARRRQYEVRDLLERLEQAVTQRDHFLAMLGHELRNPLAALLGALHVIDLIEDGAAGPIREQLARPKAIAHRQGRTLTRLVDDLLEVSRVTTGRIVLQKSRLDLGELARRSVEAARAQPQPNAPELSLAIDPQPVWVEADATRLEQVLSNLLHNALKYTPADGRVRVEVRRNGAAASLSVRDSGAGIAPAELPGVFDLFRQADVTLHRSQGGLGIGLTLVRSLVDLHGGTVVAHSDGLGRGSEFVVTLPLAPAAAGEHVKAVPVDSARSRGAGSRKVFVVEDHSDNREALVAYLERRGHEVRAAADGVAGWRGIVESRPDVALVDIGLPGLDGYEVARRVRQALGPQIHLVAISGYGRPEDEDRALRSGFDEHMTKPIDLGRLDRLLGDEIGGPAAES